MESTLEVEHAHGQATPPPMELNGRKDVVFKKLLLNSEELESS